MDSQYVIEDSFSNFKEIVKINSILGEGNVMKSRGMSPINGLKALLDLVKDVGHHVLNKMFLLNIVDMDTDHVLLDTFSDSIQGYANKTSYLIYQNWINLSVLLNMVKKDTSPQILFSCQINFKHHQKFSSSWELRILNDVFWKQTAKSFLRLK